LRDNAGVVEDSRSSGGRGTSSTGRPRGRPQKKARGKARGVTRETIIAAALREFAECGYEGATTASIARRVRVTQPLIHYHFGSKQALWRATVDSIFARLSAEVEDAERKVEGMGPAAKFVTLTYSFIDFSVSNPELARITHNEGVVHTERLEWIVENHLRPLYKRWGAYIESAKDAGIIKDLPAAFVVTALLGALAQFFDLAPLLRAVWAIEPTTQENVRAYSNAVVEMFLEGASVRIDEDFDTTDPENVGD
jgi:AcrR family transcriptional regulator